MYKNIIKTPNHSIKADFARHGLTRQKFCRQTSKI